LRGEVGVGGGDLRVLEESQREARGYHLEVHLEVRSWGGDGEWLRGG
jgi:hypothetical protein